MVVNSMNSSQQVLTDGLSNSTVDISEEKSDKQENSPQKTTTWKRIASKVPLLTVLLLLLAYFIWATVYFFENSVETLHDTTCTGYGFVLIVYAFILYGILYRLFLKQFIWKPFKNHVWTPTASYLSTIRYINYAFYILFLAVSIIYLVYDTSDDRNRLMPLTGLFVFIIGGYVCSSNRKAIKWRTVILGLALQFVFGLLTIRWNTGRNIFSCFGDKVTIFLQYAQVGAAFVYSDELVYQIGVFAFQSLATIFLIGFLVNILYYYGIMQKIVGNLGHFLQWSMGTSICESVNCAANIFLGQSEAPLLLKPYLKDLTTSEIHGVLTSGFATVSGTVLAAYINMGASASDLITASVMSAPAALCYSKLLYPEEEEVKQTKENIKLTKTEFSSAMDAASKGATDAMNLVLAIISSLIAFVSCLAAVNGVLGFMGAQVGFHDNNVWTVQLIMGKVFIPVSYIIGVPWEESEAVGKLIGIKTMVNEFVAFSEMQNMTLTPRTKMIATYAICGFSNPASIGIMVSALGELMPNKRDKVNKVIFRAFIAGAVVCLMTACYAAILYPTEMIGV